MRILMHPIEMIAYFTVEGRPKPLRYRLQQDGEPPRTIQVDRILDQAEEKLAGNRMLVFKCQSMIADCLKIYELKYEPATSKWYLYKL